MRAPSSFIFYSMLVLSLAAPSFAQEAPSITPEMGLLTADPANNGKPVYNVKLEVKNDSGIDKTRLRNYIALKAGDTYSSDISDKDTKSLYESGLVSNVMVTLTPSGDGVNVLYQVDTQTLLAGVGFTGIGDFDERKLREKTKLVSGKAINDKDIRTAIVEIRKYFADYDFPDAQIVYELQPAARQGYSDLIFKVNSGNEQMIREIRFPGNVSMDESKLKNELISQEKGIFSFLTDSGKIDNRKLDADEEKILEYYRNRGHMRAQVSPPRRIPVSEDRVDIEFPVYEGPIYKIRSVYFGKTTVYTPQELFPGLTLLAGDKYSSEKIKNDIAMIRTYYGAKGYGDAQIQADLKEVGNNEVEIQYNIVEGQPSKVGQIHIQGNTKTKDYVIRRELPLKPEDQYSSIELETAKKRLTNLNYFHNVAVTPVSSSRPGYRDVNIEVSEKETGQVTFGVGFSTISSVTFFANVTQSNFDISDWNTFTGGGQRFSVETRLGNLTQNVTVSWVEPWFMGHKLAFGVDAFYSRSTYYSDYYTQQNFGGAVSLRQPLGDKTYLRYEYRLEEIMIDTNGGAPLFFKYQDGSYLRSAINLSLVYDTRDALITPRKGHKLGLDAGFNGLGGDIRTYTAGVNGCKFWNLKWDTIFSINGAIATVEAWQNNDRLSNTALDLYSKDVPVFDRCYLGGPQNLRGFKYRDVAPYIEGQAGSGNETMGGKTSAFVQFEYTIPVVEKVRLAVFYDAGVVNEDSFDLNTTNYASDWGIGIRLNLPFGPIAVDYAWPIKAPKGYAIDDGGQFQFYMDTKF